MIDYLKLNISYLTESDLLKNPLIEWDENFSAETGALKYPIFGNYHNMSIKINPTLKQLNGSIHVLYNILETGSKQNHNDFSFDNVKEMIYHLKDVLSLDLNKTIIQNLEIGLNIATIENPTVILNQNLIAWNYETPKVNNTYSGKGKFIEFETSQLYFKLYDKGTQYNTGTYILRIENKIMRNETLKKLGITYLQDLTDKAKITALLNHLYDTYQKTVIIDKNPLQTITDAKEKEIVQNGINPLFWQNMNCRKSRQRFKTKFFDIIEKYQLNQTYKEIESKLKSKGNELLICHEMNDFKYTVTRPQNTDVSRNEPYIYFHNVTQRKCIITGIEITHQKDDSLFLSESSIYKLYETNRKEFERLNKEFSPKRKENLSLKEICYFIAHNIRNNDSNKRHEVKRKKEKYQNSLFPLNPLYDIIDNRYLQF